MKVSAEKAEAIFSNALSVRLPDRPAWLDKACGSDIDLRQTVERLLAAYDNAGDFLESRPIEAPQPTMVVTIPLTEKPGDRIGRYKLLQQIGEGGCGVVYMAEQEEPVRRRVALKVIKLGMDTKSVIARFEAERQALALMDHPNIARVLDAGATETGRPFFVMELVRGIRMTEYCDKNKLRTEERLQLFIQVCHAIQHAHQKGIIHRDIKPSNILVTLHDGVAVPKVIDFGIAKATQGRLTDQTLFTAFEQFIGTPAYMSPEQAEMSGLDIDTRSDIYALGVLLYELLTGKTPFDAKELLASGLDRMRLTIREQDPPPPSSRLSTMLDSDLTSAAACRHVEAPALVHLVRGDLDWIVMKSLEKDRTRRYETADALAGDVQRFLTDEPVQARPRSNLYRLQKLVRRNKLMFAAIGAVTLSLLLGLVASIYLYSKEKEARRRAVAAEHQQALLREQAERGLALERRLREMAPVTQQFTAAGTFMSRGQFDEAEAVMNEVHVIVPSSSIIFNALGNVRAQQRKWPLAISNYLRSITVDPTNFIAYDMIAPLLVHVGDVSGYEHHRKRIITEFATTTDPLITDSAAKDCLLLPLTTDELSDVSRLLSAASTSPDHSLAKGLLAYRKNDPPAALECLSQLAIDDFDANRAMQAYAVLAMARWQCHQPAEARAALDRADKINGSGFDWNQRMIGKLLLTQAHKLAGDNISAQDNQ